MSVAYFYFLVGDFMPLYGQFRKNAYFAASNYSKSNFLFSFMESAPNLEVCFHKEVVRQKPYNPLDSFYLFCTAAAIMAK